MSFASGKNDRDRGAVGDFNGDGIPDLAVGAGLDPSVLLGTGTGRFDPRITLPIELTALVAGDFNDDAILDLAGITLANQSPFYAVGLLLGDGTGHFSPGPTFPMDSPRSVAAADFNRDGKLDLAVANFMPGTVSVLLSTGGGQFGPAAVVKVGERAEFVLATDFNQDARPDIAVVDPVSDNVSILTNDGTGRFSPPTAIPVTYGPKALTAGDFNQDGAEDLAVLKTRPSGLLLFMGDGKGGFREAPGFFASDDSLATAGDFNQDGALDLAVTRLAGVEIHLNTGTGDFSLAFSMVLPIVASFIAAEDFDGDGKSDLAVFTPGTGQGKVFILMGEGEGKFASTAPAYLEGFCSSAGVGDFDGDGALDLAVVTLSIPWLDGHLVILKGDGLGGFTTLTRYSMGRSPWAVLVGDFNGDGLLDLAVTSRSESRVKILWGQGTGFFGAGPSYPVGSDPSFMVAGDFNADGRLDLAVSGRADHTVSVLLGDSVSGFAPAISSAAGNETGSLAPGDFNGDGRLDLAASNWGSASVLLLLGDGTGRFNEPKSFTAGGKVSSLTAADFDQNGTLDLAVTCEDPNSVGLLQNDGNGRFGLPITYELEAVPIGISAGDFNGDGWSDLVVANQDFTGATVLLNQGAGGFGRGTNYFSGGNPAFVTLTDMNKDGRPDLVIPLAGGGVGVLLNTCGVNSSSAFVARLFFPRLVAGSKQGTGIAIVNLDGAAGTLRFTAVDRNGVAVNGSNITNPVTRHVNACSQIALMNVDVFGGGLTSSQPGNWLKVESTVRKIAGFFLVLDPTVTVLDGADVSSRTLTSFVFPEIATSADSFTQLHIVNPQASSNQTTVELVNADGRVRSRADRTIAPNGSVLESVAELFPAVTSEPSDYVRATATLGVVAFEFLGRDGRFVQGLNGQGTASGATTLYSPQYVVGGPNLTSTLSVVNLGDTSGTVTFRFVGDDGVVIAMQQRPIAPRGKLLIADQSFSTTTVDQVTGYVEIVSSGPRLAGSVVFGDQARSTFSSALPLVADLHADMIFAQVASAVGSSPPWFTGLALLNPGSTDANAKVQVFDPNGAVVSTGTFVIPVRGRRSQLLTEYFPELVGRDILGGYIRVTTDRPLASFVLFGTWTLSVLSAVTPLLVP